MKKKSLSFKASARSFGRAWVSEVLPNMHISVGKRKQHLYTTMHLLLFPDLGRQTYVGRLNVNFCGISAEHKDRATDT